jgi:hypothetical protein
LQERPADNDRYVRNCRNGRSPKETRWWFHDDKVWWVPTVASPGSSSYTWAHHSMAVIFHEGLFRQIFQAIYLMAN